VISTLSSTFSVSPGYVKFEEPTSANQSTYAIGVVRELVTERAPQAGVLSMDGLGFGKMLASHQGDDNKREETERDRDDAGLGERHDGVLGPQSVDLGEGVGAEQDPRRRRWCR